MLGQSRQTLQRIQHLEKYASTKEQVDHHEVY